MKKLRSRLTYANVVASLALFVALAGGSAFAASQFGKETIGTRALKKEAVTPLKLSQKAKATLEGPKGATGATGAKGATGPQGPKGDTGAAATTLWAVVNGDGTFARESGVSTNGKLATGEYYVEFFRNVTGCNFQVTPGNPGVGVTGIAPAFAAVRVSPTDPEAIRVHTYNSQGAPVDDSFYAAVFC